MKGYTKLIAGLTVLALVLCAGCGKAPAPAPAPSPAAESTAAAESAAAPEAASEAAAETAPAEPGAQETGEYISPDGWSVTYPVPDVEANEIDEHTAAFVYVAESAGTNMVTVSFVADRQPEEAMYEITEGWGDDEAIERGEGIFPGTDDKWGYWRILEPAEDGSGLSEALIGGEYNGGTLLFEITAHSGSTEEEDTAVSDTLSEIVNSIRYTEFGPQTMYDYFPGTYSASDAGSGAVYSVILNEDHTGQLKLQDEVDILWGSYLLYLPDGAVCEYDIEGDTLLLKQGEEWVPYERENAGTEEPEAAEEEEPDVSGYVYMGGLYISDPQNDLMMAIYRNPDADPQAAVYKLGEYMTGDFTTESAKTADGTEYTKMLFAGREYGYHFAMDGKDSNILVDEDGTVYEAKNLYEGAAVDILTEALKRAK